MLYTLNFEGKLFKDHLPILTGNHLSVQKTKLSAAQGKFTPIYRKFSSQGLVVFSKLTALMDNCKICRDGLISITTTTISDYICQGQVLTGRMVRHQLNLLTQEAPLLISNTQYKNTCQIAITKGENKQFLPIFGIKKVSKSSDDCTEKSEYIADCTLMLILSMMLDKASFNYRAGDGFNVSPIQIKHLVTDLNITEKTVINTLTKMVDLEMISVNEPETDTKLSGKALLNHSISFSDNLFNEYSKLISLTISKKCLKYSKKKIHKIKEGYACVNKNTASIQNENTVRTIYEEKIKLPEIVKNSVTNTKTENNNQNTTITELSSDIKDMTKHQLISKDDLFRLTALKNIESELNSHHVDNLLFPKKYSHGVKNFWSHTQKTFVPCEKNLVTYIS